MSGIRELLKATPVVPVVVVDSAAQGVEVARALAAGGVMTAEVTFRTAAARDAIAAISAELPDVVVGAGTVVTAQQADDAIAAGAEYVVSPGFSPAVVRACQDAGVPVLPSCTDGSWIMAALEAGLDTVKFFPAGVLGGLGAIKAYSAPFPGLKFVPTGGVNAANLAAFLAVPSVLACGGSWLVNKHLVAEQAWGEITRLSREAMTIAAEVAA